MEVRVPAIAARFCVSEGAEAEAAPIWRLDRLEVSSTTSASKRYPGEEVGYKICRLGSRPGIDGARSVLGQSFPDETPGQTDAASVSLSSSPRDSPRREEEVERLRRERIVSPAGSTPRSPTSICKL